MTIKTLYRTNNNGKVTVTPNKPTGEYTETYRLIADEDKVLTDGVNTYPCVDTDYPEKFVGISESSENDYAEAGRILLGVSE